MSLTAPAMNTLPRKLWIVFLTRLTDTIVSAHLRSNLEDIDHKHIQHIEPVFTSDQPAKFPDLDAIFQDLDEIVKRENGDHVRWSSISGYPEQVLILLRTFAS